MFPVLNRKYKNRDFGNKIRFIHVSFYHDFPSLSYGNSASQKNTCKPADTAKKTSQNKMNLSQKMVSSQKTGGVGDKEWTDKDA